MDAPTPALHRAQSGPGVPDINPVTGLSTDYLNHFAEAIMALEMAGTAPECLDDLRDWRPKTYAEHFASSRFRHRDIVIRAYQAADPVLRAALDAASETLNASLAATRDAAMNGGTKKDALAHRALADVRPLIAHMAALINGTTDTEGVGTQAAIDAMFER